MWTAIAAITGLVTTLIAYFLNPGRRKTEELNKIFKELDTLYERRDRALETNNTNDLTYITARIIFLRSRKDNLL